QACDGERPAKDLDADSEDFEIHGRRSNPESHNGSERDAASEQAANHRNNSTRAEGGKCTNPSSHSDGGSHSHSEGAMDQGIKPKFSQEYGKDHTKEEDREDPPGRVSNKLENSESFMNNKCLIHLTTSFDK